MSAAAVLFFFFFAGYFNRASGMKLFRRCCVLMVCSLFWVYIRTCLLSHSLLLPDDFAECYSWRYRATLWFLQYLALWLLLTPLYLKLPRLLQGCVLVLLAWFSVTRVILPAVPDPHISYFVSAFFFYLGCSFQQVKIQELHKKLFICTDGTKVKCAFGVSLTLLLIVAIVNTLGIPWVKSHIGWLMLPTAYIMASTAFYAERVFPTLTAKVASAGPSVIFLYVFHPPVFHVWAGGWPMVCGMDAPKLLTLPLMASLFVICPYLYKRLQGKWKLTDAILFAR